MITRRSFLAHAGAGLAGAAGTGILFSPGATLGQSSTSSPKKEELFRLGAAGYTFNKFKLQPALEMLKQVDVHYLCIKDFHLPLESTDEEIAAFHAQCARFNVTGYGVGPIYMGSAEEVGKAFAYAQRVGVKLVVGVPFKLIEKKRTASPELLKVIQQNVQEFDIHYAIHNHGPDMPELFPNAESVMELIRDLDKRIGLCLDIGHQFRDGKDPIQAMQAFGDRVYDIHLKNVSAPDKGGRSVELPRGRIDIPGFVRALRRARYAGVCSLEYEKDMDRPLAGIAESIGYFRGVLAGLS